MKYKIILDKQSRTNPSNEKKEYEIDIEELRTRRNVYDSIVITREEAYVLRKLMLSDLQVLSELPEPVKEPLNDLKIELFEGDNYIYLVDMVGNKFYAEYLIKNEFTDLYVTLNEMNSAINQSAQQIDLTVNQKLEGYSTTQEMNSAINMKANEITSTVQSNYATKEALNTAKSEIKQTTDSITSTVSKKVGNDEIISKINQSAEQVGINANKIQLSANDILNLLAGNAINLTSKNIIISSDKFSVDKNGKVTCSDINITGGNIILKTTRNGQLFKIIVDGNENTGFITTPQSLQFNFNGDDRADFGVNNSGNGFMSIMNSSGQTTSVHGEGISTPKLTQTSLKSKKKNIKKLNTNALDLIKNSDICLYNLKQEKAKSKKHIGLVIGEGYNCPNEVISEDGQGVEQYSMTSLAWKAIQELIEEKNKLKERIEKLEVQNGKN